MLEKVREFENREQTARKGLENFTTRSKPLERDFRACERQEAREGHGVHEGQEAREVAANPRRAESPREIEGQKGGRQGTREEQGARERSELA